MTVIPESDSMDVERTVARIVRCIGDAELSIEPCQNIYLTDVFPDNVHRRGLSFDEALPLFDDESFDFIYVDGYAHTGEEGGKTFFDWWPKLKPGGIFSGHDYHRDWPLTMRAVDEFVARNGLTLHLLNEDPLDQTEFAYPSWLTFKPSRR